MQRRTPLRRTSLQRKPARYPGAAALAARREWGNGWCRCWLCRGGGFPGFEHYLHTHEICRRSQAPGRWCDTANFLRVCGDCHAEKLANITVAPYAVQLAVKRIRDPEHYSFERFLEIVGRPAVTPEEVELVYRALVMVGFGE